MGLFFKKLTLYLICLAFIVTWWIAFIHFPNRNSKNPLIRTYISEDSPAPIISREDLHKALSGEIDLMIDLVSNWNQDRAAQMMDLALQINNKSSGQDLRILPQTESAASFILALTNPEQIVAIPQNIRKQTQLYSKELTSKIPIDVGSYSREQLFLLQPTIALVGNYSNPAFIQNLIDQKIEVISLKNLQYLSDFRPAIIEIGNILDQSFRAEIFAIFIETALESMENHLKSMQKTENRSPRILYLNYCGKYCTPTKKTLLGQMFVSLQINEGLTIANPRHLLLWQIPLTQEQIVNYNPDYLILSTSTKKQALKILQEPAFAKLKALQKVFFVDEVVQEAFSQYILLAYYDLYRIILEINQK